MAHTTKLRDYAHTSNFNQLRICHYPFEIVQITYVLCALQTHSIRLRTTAIKTENGDP